MNNRNLENIKNLYENLEAPDELQNKILSTINNAPESAKSSVKIKANRIPLKRFVLIAAAVMLSLTLVVSAVTIAYNIYNGMYMLPGMGLFDGFNENVLTMPKVLDFGEGTIESAMTYNQDGANKFYMIIYAEGNRQTGPAPDKNDYQNVEIVFPTGEPIQLEGQEYGGGWSSNGDYNFAYKYECENFPGEHEFILKNSAGASTEITLSQIEPRMMKITDNGLKRIKMIPAAEGSKLLSYNIEVIKPSLLETAALYTIYMIGDASVYGKNGAETFIGSNMQTGHGTPIFAVNENDAFKYYTFGEIFILNWNDRAETAVDKITIKRMRANITLFDNYATVKLPLPQDGERFDYDAPLEIAQIGEFTLSVDAVKREKNNLLVYTSQRDINYSGNEDISDISFSFTDSGSRGNTSTDNPDIYTVVHTMKIPEDYSGDVFETFIVDISYIVNGDWEIAFE